MSTVDQDLNFILNGGKISKKLKSKTKTKLKKVNPNTSGKNKTKKNKKSHSDKSIEASIIMRDIEISDEFENNAKQSRLNARPNIVKKDADENTEYISVKNEKKGSINNSYKPYDLTFLKRLEFTKNQQTDTDSENLQ